VKLRMPDVAERLAGQVVKVVQAVRALDLKKRPSVSETLDWARALMVLNADELETELVNDTMNVILKHQGDIAKAQSELNALLQRKAAEKAAGAPAAAPAAPAAPAKKSVLH
jgi:prophage DNA circulation protein